MNTWLYCNALHYCVIMRSIPVRLLTLRMGGGLSLSGEQMFFGFGPDGLKYSSATLTRDLRHPSQQVTKQPSETAHSEGCFILFRKHEKNGKMLSISMIGSKPRPSPEHPSQSHSIAQHDSGSLAKRLPCKIRIRGKTAHLGPIRTSAMLGHGSVPLLHIKE
jgi:hypothetical protein